MTARKIWIARPLAKFGSPAISENVLIKETEKTFRVRGPQWGWNDRETEFRISKDGNRSGEIEKPFRTEREAVEYMIENRERKLRGLWDQTHKTELSLKKHRRRFSEIENEIVNND